MIFSQETTNRIVAWSAILTATSIVGAFLWALIGVGASSAVGQQIGQNHGLIEKNREQIEHLTHELDETQRQIEDLRNQFLAHQNIPIE